MTDIKHTLERIDALLNTAQVAELLGIDAKTVRALVSQGRLERIVITSRCIRFDPEDVEKFKRESRCLSTNRKTAASGTMTSNMRGGVSTVRRGKTQSAPLKPWNAQSDLKPRPVAITTPEK